MARLEKRTRLQIYNDILLAVKDDTLLYGESRLTRVQGRANLPSDRFRAHLEKLVAQHLLKIIHSNTSRTLKLTSKGEEFVKEYEKAVRMLKRFGL